MKISCGKGRKSPVTLWNKVTYSCHPGHSRKGYEPLFHLCVMFTFTLQLLAWTAPPKIVRRLVLQLPSLVILPAEESELLRELLPANNFCDSSSWRSFPTLQIWLENYVFRALLNHFLILFYKNLVQLIPSVTAVQIMTGLKAHTVSMAGSQYHGCLGIATGNK